MPKPRTVRRNSNINPRLRLADGPATNRLKSSCPDYFEMRKLSAKSQDLETMFNDIALKHTVTPQVVKKILVAYGHGLEDHLVKFGAVNVFDMCKLSSRLKKATSEHTFVCFAKCVNLCGA